MEQISQRVAERLVRSDLAATSLTLKLRRHDRYTTTHACRLHDPTQRAETILAAVVPVLRLSWTARATAWSASPRMTWFRASRPTRPISSTGPSVQ